MTLWLRTGLIMVGSFVVGVVITASFGFWYLLWFAAFCGVGHWCWYRLWQIWSPKQVIQPLHCTTDVLHWGDGPEDPDQRQDGDVPHDHGRPRLGRQQTRDLDPR